jgi:ribulose-5-phosphate 4-epimerase/fuculose-1-phosphate aldolase
VLRKVRDRFSDDTCVEKALGVVLKSMSREEKDKLGLLEDGKVVGGNTSRPANGAGFLIHSAVHKARPDVHAACHMHGKAGKAWSAFGKKLEMINQDVCKCVCVYLSRYCGSYIPGSLWLTGNVHP